MLKYAPLVLGSFLLASQAEAQTISQYYSTSLSCSEVQARISAEGAAIMRYSSPNNPNLPRYDRYVANGNLCSIGTIVDDVYIPASDTDHCKVKRCKLKVLDRNGRRM